MFNYIFQIELDTAVSIDETLSQLQNGIILLNRFNSHFDDVIGEIVNVEKYDTECWAMVFIKREVDIWLSIVNRLFIIKLTVTNDKINNCSLCKM